MDKLKTKASLDVDGRRVSYYSLAALERAGIGHPSRLPFSLKVLLENLLRREDGRSVTAEHIKALAAWDPASPPDINIAMQPARVLLARFHGRAGRRRPRRHA